MRIHNNTAYRTADLRKFFLAGIRSMGAESNKEIHVHYSRGSVHRGRATYGQPGVQGSWIAMWLPRDPAKLQLSTFARVFEHEVSHNLGVRHQDMSDNVRYCRGALPKWAEGLELTFQAPKPKPKVDLVEKREAHARKMEAKWLKKLVAAQRVHRKWKLKVRYYERRQAAAGRSE